MDLHHCNVFKAILHEETYLLTGRLFYNSWTPSLWKRDGDMEPDIFVVPPGHVLHDLQKLLVCIRTWQRELRQDLRGSEVAQESKRYVGWVCFNKVPATPAMPSCISSYNATKEPIPLALDPSLRSMSSGRLS